MDKALKLGKKSATGSFKLSIGLVSSTVLLALSTIIIGNILSPDELGIYFVALIPSSMFALFRDLGIEAALIRFTAKFQSSGEEGKTRNIIITGAVFEIIVGSLLSFLCFILANFIGSTIFSRPESVLLISIASISIFSQALLVAANSILIGLNRMGFSSFMTVSNSIIQVTISVSLVLLGYGALGPVVGYTFAPLVTGAIGLIKVYFLFFRNTKNRTRSLGFLDSLKTMLHYGLPFSSTTILPGFLGQFYGFLMAIYITSDVLIGNYKIALNFAVLLTFFTKPVTTVLFPTFSKINPEKENKLLKTVFNSSVKYIALLLVPATMALMILSEPIVTALFQNRYIYAPAFLTLYIISNLFHALGGFSESSLLSGIGETRFQMKQSLLKLVFGISLAVLLIPTFGIWGVIAVAVLTGLPSLFWGLYWIWKKYKVKANYKPIIKTFAASAVAAVASFLSFNLLNAISWTGLIIGGTVFVGFYLFALPMLDGVDEIEIQNLRSMFSGLGLVTKILNIPLYLMERILVFHRTRDRHNQADI